MGEMKIWMAQEMAEREAYEYVYEALEKVMREWDNNTLLAAVQEENFMKDRAIFIEAKVILEKKGIDIKKLLKSKIVELAEDQRSELEKALLEEMRTWTTLAVSTASTLSNEETMQGAAKKVLEERRREDQLRGVRKLYPCASGSLIRSKI